MKTGVMRRLSFIFLIIIAAAAFFLYPQFPKFQQARKDKLLSDLELKLKKQAEILYNTKPNDPKRNEVAVEYRRIREEISKIEPDYWKKKLERLKLHRDPLPSKATTMTPNMSNTSPPEQTQKYVSAPEKEGQLVGSNEKELFHQAMETLRKAWINKQNEEANERKGIELLNKAIVINPDFVDAYAVLINIYMYSTTAVRNCEKANEINDKKIWMKVTKKIEVSDNIENMFDLSICEREGNRLREETRKKFNERDKLDFFVLYDLGKEKFDALQKAIYHTEEERTIHILIPTTEEAAWIEKIRNKRIQRLKKALEMAPDYKKEGIKKLIAQEYSSMASIYTLQTTENVAKVIQYCSEALKFNVAAGGGDDWLCHERLGWAYAKIGQTDKAIQFYEKYVSKQSWNVKAKENLEKLRQKANLK